jgi:hypothetical protein
MARVAQTSDYMKSFQKGFPPHCTYLIHNVEILDVVNQRILERPLGQMILGLSSGRKRSVGLLGAEVPRAAAVQVVEGAGGPELELLPELLGGAGAKLGTMLRF